MSLPVRCFTCGYIIGIYEDEYKEKISNGGKIEEILDSLKIDSYCCRRMFLGYVDTLSQLLLFPDRLYSKYKNSLMENFYISKMEKEGKLLSEFENSNSFPDSIKKLYVIDEIKKE
jgi:DNA-directed RNA polymerase subunit N